MTLCNTFISKWF